MKSKLFALALAATLIAGSMGTARAEEDGCPAMCYGNESGEFRCGPGRHHRGPGEFRRGPGKGFGHGPAFRDHDMDRGPMGGPGSHGMYGMRMLERLDLDKAQQDKLVDIMTDNYRGMLEARIALREAKQKLRELRDSDASAEAVIAANQELGAAKGKLEVAMRQGKENIESVLTPEQKGKLEAARESFRDGPPPRHGRLDGERGNRGERDGRGKRYDRESGPRRDAPPPRR